MYLFFSLFILLLLSGCGQSDSNDFPVYTETSCAFPVDTPVMDNRPLLVIRINYNNVQFQNNAYTWSNKIFGNNEHELNHYYHEISTGHFNFVKTSEREGMLADGIVTVTLDKNHPDSDSSPSIHSDFYDALTMADPYINYALYDKNNDKNLTPDELIVMFMIAGDEDSFSGITEEPGVWAHQSCTLKTNTPLLDGVNLLGCSFGGNYAVFGERHHFGNYNEDATIGIIAHELGHAAFDLPDLYDTSGASAGIGYFGLMGAGMWARESETDLFGNTPVHMMAWSKLKNNWIIPERITTTTSQQVTLHASGSDAYNIVMLSINPNECFLLENRHRLGYDKGMFSLNSDNSTFTGGMAIWHIDQEVIEKNTRTNLVNADKDHKGVDLEEAAKAELDDNTNASGHEKNLYYAGNKTIFTSKTIPNSNRYDNTDSGVAVNNISAPAYIMSASVINPN
ncbi:MAG: hypothetical protein DRG24_01140 [Epsilonproteobacteria bacterium]|nr:MAG: hypothetical protein DRG24_01140 [Campylobacterota bacterium]